jgi:putative membrane protein
MFPMWDWGSGGWWMGFGFIWMVLFWGAFIALIVWAVKKFTGGTSANRKNDPIDIARERYARGEITKEEFEQIKKTLS